MPGLALCQDTRHRPACAVSKQGTGSRLFVAASKSSLSEPLSPCMDCCLLLQDFCARLRFDPPGAAEFVKAKAGSKVAEAQAPASAARRHSRKSAVAAAGAAAPRWWPISVDGNVVEVRDEYRCVGSKPWNLGASTAVSTGYAEDTGCS